MMTAFFIVATEVKADPYQAQIDALNQEIRRDQSRANSLRERRDTLENRLAQLQAETNRLQAQIDKTNLEVKQTNAELDAAEKELERQKTIIQENVRTLYMTGEVNTIEVLFSSSNFSEYINRQEYLNQVKDALDAAAEQTQILKQQLEDKQAELEQLLNRQRTERTALENRQREQRQLIAETRGEERRYQTLVASNRQELARLEEQQRAAYAAAAAAARRSGQFNAVGGSGSYPWANAPYPCWSAGCADPWGLYYRECVSYTAWKVASTGRFVPHFAGAGHARQWPATTARHGIANGSQPRVGSVAIDSRIQPYGHAMYVEQVHGNGMITISEYNFAGPGQYSVRTIPAAGLTYIYF